MSAGTSGELVVISRSGSLPLHHERAISHRSGTRELSFRTSAFDSVRRSSSSSALPGRDVRRQPSPLREDDVDPIARANKVANSTDTFASEGIGLRSCMKRKRGEQYINTGMEIAAKEHCVARRVSIPTEPTFPPHVQSGYDKSVKALEEAHAHAKTFFDSMTEACTEARQEYFRTKVKTYHLNRREAAVNKREETLAAKEAEYVKRKTKLIEERAAQQDQIQRTIKFQENVEAQEADLKIREDAVNRMVASVSTRAAEIAEAEKSLQARTKGVTERETVCTGREITLDQIEAELRATVENLREKERVLLEREARIKHTLAQLGALSAQLSDM